MFFVVCGTAATAVGAACAALASFRGRYVLRVGPEPRVPTFSRRWRFAWARTELCYCVHIFELAR